MPALPSSLSLTSIPDGSGIIAADHRNNYAAIQTAENAVITALSGGTAGDVLGGNGTTLTYAKPPGYEYSYVETTVSVNVVGTTEGTATTVLTAGAVTFDGSTSVWLEFFAPYIIKGTTNITVTFFDGATGYGGSVGVTPTGIETFTLRKRVTPSAAAHTYSVRAWVDAGTGTIRAGAGGAGGANLPACLRIVKV